MGGFDDQVAVMGGWLSPNPSPRPFFSMGDDISSRSILELPNDNKNESLFPWSQEQTKASDEKNEALSVVAGDQSNEANASPGQKMNSRGGLMERIAARAGFNAPRLNTEGIRPSQLSLNAGTRSPYLTIPPGLSPTSLLESPVFLSNSLAQPSPTTGKFPFASSCNGRNSTLGLDGSDKDKENFFEDNIPSFAFQPVPDSAPSRFLGASNKAIQTFSQQCFSGTDVSLHPERLFQPRNVEHQNGTMPSFQDFSRSRDGDVATYNVAVAVGPISEHQSPADEEQDEEPDHRGGGDTVVGGGAPADDGYNWRKYGQKQVKGSDYPRSYYKCTNPNCPVKKKVERSQEGHITEIIYKGAHNHPKPPSNRRSAVGPSSMSANVQIDQTSSHVSAGTPEWGPDNLEVTSSENIGGNYRDAPNSLQDQHGTHLGKRDAMEGSTTFSNDEDDRGTHGSASLGYDGEGDESESKRRRMEAYATEMSGASRAIREPRVVVQTTSEVDILDDGYRWRKYGQKVVKGNPNPRSYYKCTSTGCTVRKHVERASHDLKSVITTYEGKHNHDVPAARNSSHANSVNVNGTGQTGLGGVGGSSVPAHLQRPLQSQLHNSMGRFDGSSGLSSFGLPGRHQLGHGNGFGFSMNQPGLANLGMAGLGAHQGKLPPAHSAFGGLHRPAMNEMGFMLPKGEPKMEPMSELPLNLPTNGSSSAYQQIMGRLHM